MRRKSAGRALRTRPAQRVLLDSAAVKRQAAEFRAVLAELADALKPVAEVAYVTGWRIRSELLTRQWMHVDFEAGWIRLEPGETKNRDGRMFPMTPTPRAVLLFFASQHPAWSGVWAKRLDRQPQSAFMTPGFEA